MKIEKGLQCPLSTFSTPQQDSNLAASHEQSRLVGVIYSMYYGSPVMV
jgi:hypothetical protein